MAGPVRGLGIARPDDAARKDAPGYPEGHVALFGLEVVAGDDFSGGNGAGMRQPEAGGNERNGADTDGCPAVAAHQLAKRGDREDARHGGACPDDEGAGDGKGRPLAGISCAAGLGNHAQKKP